MFNIFINTLQQQLMQTLPGQDAQYKMGSADRFRLNLREMEQLNAREAAVLILFYAVKDRPYLVFMQRNHYPGVHSNQISFPGGKYETHDEDLVATALRESNEELNINKEQVNVLGKLTKLYIPPSNFLVEPVVGTCRQRPHFIPDRNEVAEIIEIPFSFFFQTNAVQMVTVPSGQTEYTVPAYVNGDSTIWGATAMILSELICLMQEVNLDWQ